MRPYTVLAALMLFFTPFTAAEEAQMQDKPSTDIHAANARLGRGINLGNALDAPKEGEWGVTLRPEYFRLIKAAGFDSVRLPVRWSAHAGSEPPYTIDPEFAERVDWAIDQALANDLNVVVNVHHYNEICDDPDAHAERLVGLWRQIAARYADRDERVYFELFNEPRGKLTPEKWNAMIPGLLAVVRETNPTRPVIVGPGDWNSFRGLPKLELPDDRNIIVTVHYYDPFEFTHQNASWVDGADKWLGRQWQGTDEEQAAVRAALDTAAEWGKASNRPVYVGEFGAYSAADDASRIRWTRFVARECEKRGMSFAYWEFCSGFGAYDPEAEAWRDGLKGALVD